MFSCWFGYQFQRALTICFTFMFNYVDPMPFNRDVLLDVYSLNYIQKIYIGDTNYSFIGLFRNFLIAQSDIPLVVESYYKCGTPNHLFIGIQARNV